MKRFYLISLLTLAMGCTTTEQKGEQATSPAADSVAAAAPASRRVDYDQVRGIWINTQFELTLRQTLSPRQAAAAEVPNVSFYREEGEPVAFVNLGFREGITVPLDSLQPAGSGLRNREVEIEFTPDRTGFSLRLLNGQPMSRPATFRRLNDEAFNSLDEEHEALLGYVNGVVLAGEYQDAEGNTYQFTPEMKAVLPDASFTYELALNDLFTDCDGIYAVEGGAGRTSLGFSRKGDALRLYRTRPDPENPDGVVCEKKPYAELTRTARQ
jgi:hypothetical protein